MSLGLYVHIPFCKKRCRYCNFVSSENTSPEFRSLFFSALFDQMKECRNRVSGLTFSTVYIGGGTPSFLSTPELTWLFEEIRENFDVVKDAEITCEWNPGDGEEMKFSVLRILGVNRISLGTQSFQDSLLARLGRQHRVYDSLKTVEKIQNAGIRNISMDLMLRIPGQQVEDVAESLQRCVELGAAQVSLYDLEIHEGTFFGILDQKGVLPLPDEEEHARMYQTAAEVLGSAGYEHYEISNFAKPGLASRHNLLYWNNQEYIGLGPGAYSYFGGMRYQFAGDVPGYIEKCMTKNWQNDQEDVLSDVEKETETFTMALRLERGVVPERFPRIYPGLCERVRSLSKEGLLQSSQGLLRLTERGKCLSEDVFAFLLQKKIGPR